MPSLDLKLCAARRARFEAVAAQHRLDVLIVTDVRDMPYLIGHTYINHQPYPAAGIYAKNQGWLFAGPGAPPQVENVTTIGYEAALGGTSHPDWVIRLTAALLGQSQFIHGAGRIGYQSETMTHHMLSVIANGSGAAGSPDLIDVNIPLLEAQRVKDADELALMKKAIACNQAAYRAAEATIAPSVPEHYVLAAAANAALKEAGEHVYHNGEYHAGAPGGFATDEKMTTGQMLVIDAWTIYRNYWCDMSRAYRIDGKPTDTQVSLFNHIAQTHKQVSPMFKPGADGIEIYKAADTWLRQHPLLKEKGLTHHAGHGTGIRAHAMPDLNPTRGGTLQAGEVICFEPGAYLPGEAFYCRLENMYLINATGPATCLCDLPFNLTV
jgi:Xaa-Pro dipeptidase